ncbi:MAG: transcriptional regulator [Woeseia sp.]|nr:transcriptional regulator [Woeseia sp.]|tara:strand:- start:8842 stop:10215 length:1374 start_codon:yes stop_codon:yes gene_type:complete
MSASKVLVVDDEADIRALIEEILSEEGYEVTVAGDASEARRSKTLSRFDLILLDIWMPETDGISLLHEWTEAGPLDCPVVMMSGHGTVDTAVEATRLGAFDFVEKPLSLAKLLHTVERAIDAMGKPSSQGRRRLPSALLPIGRSSVMRALRDTLDSLAQNDSWQLFAGEVGSGRKDFARYIHSKSSRADSPLVILPSAALTENNVEKQLLGKEDGDDVYSGFFEQAKNGTLIINELTDLSEQAQKLVKGVMEEAKFMRVDGHTVVPMQARIFATVNIDYEKVIEDRKLRRDLISVFKAKPVYVPPLREYLQDVPEILNHYVDRLVDADCLPFRRFSVAAQNRLRNYPWPNNLKELENLVNTILASNREGEISLAEVEAQMSLVPAIAHGSIVQQDLLSLPLREAREQFERSYLIQQLTLCGGKVGKLAQRVGMERTHLYRKLRALGIDFRAAGQGKS